MDNDDHRRVQADDRRGQAQGERRGGIRGREAGVRHRGEAGEGRQVGSTSPAIQGEATNDDRCFDISGHKTVFVTVEPDVQLEVLDWGGTGETMVLLTGLGTTRTFSISSHTSSPTAFMSSASRAGASGDPASPPTAMTLTRRARDDIAVLDKLNIRQAVFVGHSLAGSELSKLGAAYPDRVKKLVYLDAFDIGSGGWAASLSRRLPRSLLQRIWNRCSVLPQPWHVTTGTESLSPRSATWSGRTPRAGLLERLRLPRFRSKIYAGLKPAEYGRIQAPALGIFNRISPQFRMPYYGSLEPAKQEEFDRSIKRFRSGTTARSSASAPR